MMFQAMTIGRPGTCYGLRDYETADGVRQILALEDGMEAAEFRGPSKAA